MFNSTIKTLNDLNNFRSAPALDVEQSKKLLIELSIPMETADWFTIGIMSPSSNSAISVLQEMTRHFDWPEMRVTEEPKTQGPVFLKANQKTGEVHVRIEYGLGEGILLSCQHNQTNKDAETFGPFPLNFFKVKE